MFVLRLEQSLSRSATAPFTQGSLFIGAKRREVSPFGRRGRVYFFCQARQKKIPKRTRLKGYANRKGYALIYLDIARLLFFPKHTIRLYFNSRLRRSEMAVCEHSAGTWGMSHARRAGRTSWRRGKKGLLPPFIYANFSVSVLLSTSPHSLFAPKAL